MFFSEEFRPDIEFPTFLALVAAGVDRSLKNNDGKTAFDLGVEYEYPEEYLKLLNPDAKVPASDFLWLGTSDCEGLLPKGMASFELDGVTWPSAEHYFHAQKTEDKDAREYIRGAKMSDDVRGRLNDLKIKPPGNWESRCDAIMRAALLAKFQQNDTLRRQLLETGKAILVSDSNSRLSYWVERRGAGFNVIGKMLMNIREELGAVLTTDGHG